MVRVEPDASISSRMLRAASRVSSERSVSSSLSGSSARRTCDEIEELLDEAAQAPRVTLELPDPLADRGELVGRGAGAVVDRAKLVRSLHGDPLQHPGLEAHAPHRRLELVRGDREDLVPVPDLLLGRLELPLPLLQGAPLGDVADHGDRADVGSDLQGSQADVHRELAAIVAEARELEPHPHRTQARRGEVGLELDGVPRPEPVRHEDAQWPAHELGGVVAEQELGGPVRIADRAVPVADDHGVGHERQQLEVHRAPPDRDPDAELMAPRGGGWPIWGMNPTARDAPSGAHTVTASWSALRRPAAGRGPVRSRRGTGRLAPGPRRDG